MTRLDDMLERYGEVCTQKTAGKILNVVPRTIARMMDEGRLRRVGRSVDVRSIFEYIENPRELDMRAKANRANGVNGGNRLNEASRTNGTNRMNGANRANGVNGAIRANGVNGVSRMNGANQSGQSTGTPSRTARTRSTFSEGAFLTAARSGSWAPRR